MDDINDLTVDDLQFYLRKYRFNDDCLKYFRENEIDGFTLNLMSEIPEYFSAKLGFKLKFKLMFMELTGRDIEINTQVSVPDQNHSNKNIYAPTPIRQSDYRSSSIINEKENIINSLCFSRGRTSDDNFVKETSKSAPVIVNANNDNHLNISTNNKQSKQHIVSVDLSPSENEQRYDENINESTISSNGDLSDDDDDEDEEATFKDIPLPMFQEKIENELLYGDIDQILKTFVREVADFYIKNNIPINKSKHYKKIAISLFKKYEHLKKYFEKEAMLLNYSNSIKATPNSNFKTIQAYRQLTKRLAHRVRNLRFKYKASKCDSMQSSNITTHPLSNKEQPKDFFPSNEFNIINKKFEPF